MILLPKKFFFLACLAFFFACAAGCDSNRSGFKVNVSVYGSHDVWEGVDSIRIDGHQPLYPPAETLVKGENNVPEKITVAHFTLCTNNAQLFFSKPALDFVVVKDSKRVVTRVPRIACIYEESKDREGMKESISLNLLPDGTINRNILEGGKRQSTSCNPIRSVKCDQETLSLHEVFHQ